MPIWTNPPRKLLTTLRRLRDDARNRGQIEFMPVDAVNADSSYEVGDVQARVPATGTAQDVRAGDRVPVATISGQPIAIFAHSARRAQFHPAPPIALGAVIEELFLSGNRDTGVFDVYFRNFDQVTKLGLTAFVGATGAPGSVPTSLLAWGAGTDRFLLKTGDVVRVFKLNRRANTSYQPGQKARATLESAVNLTTVAGIAYAGLTASFGTAIIPTHTYTLNVPFADVNLIIPDNEGGGTFMTVSTNFITALLDERGHVIVTFALFFSFSQFPGNQGVRSFVCDVTTPTALFGPHQDVTNVPPVLMLNFGFVGSPSTKLSPSAYQVEVASVRGGALAQYTVYQERQGGQVVGLPFDTEITFLVPGAQSVKLLDEYPGTHQVFLQASRRHLLWAVSPLSNPFSNPAQVYMQALAVPDVTPPILAGASYQVGTTLSKFFFPLSADTYGNPLMLLRPFDVLWASVVVDTAPNPDVIVSELFFPVVAWKTSDPSVITLLETDPKFPVKDTAITRVTGMKKLPTGVVIVGGSLTPAVQVFQALNDASVLATVGRTRTT